MANYFKNIIGHDFEVEQLERFLKKGNLPHALLFTGIEGVGKFYCALMLAWSLLNSGNDTSLDKLLHNGNHPDLHIADVEEGKKDIAVDDIRGIISALQLKPYYSRCALALINNAHRMNLASANALLKTLEEPNPNTHLILVTSAPNRLPETIISRCQGLCFGDLSQDSIALILKKLFAQTTMDEKALGNLQSICAGSLNILGVSRLINIRTGIVAETKELESHTKNFFKDLSELEKSIENIVSAPSDKNLTSALCLVANLGAEKENKNKATLFWHLLKKQIREELHSASGEKINYWAKWLEDTITCEQLVTERNANMSLQTSSLFANAM